jgi:hypothetical protein
MKTKAPEFEFSRPLIVDRVPRKGSHENVVAEANECEKLAKRFSIPALHKLGARLHCVPWRGGGLKVTGTVEADLELLSVVSLEHFAKHEKFELERYFLPDKKLVDETEVDADPIRDGIVDLGEIVAETLGLEIDPYPRKPGETFGDVVKN